MSLRASRIAVTAFVALGSALPGCDGCGDGPVDPPGRADLSVELPDGFRLTSDGTARVRLIATAETADGKPDTAAMTVVATEGFLAPAGGDFAQGTTLVVTPDGNGSATVEFGCVIGSSESVTITFDNGSSDDSVSVSCRAPEGPIVIAVNDDACDDVTADGETVCEVTLRVVQTAGDQEVPQSGNVLVRVDATTPDLAAGGVDELLLSAADSGIAPASNVTVPIVNGAGSFAFAVPEVPELVSLELTFDAPACQAAPCQPATNEIVVGEFVDNSALSISADRTSVIGGTTAALTVSAIGVNGEPAANGFVDLAVVGVPPASVTAGGSTGASLSDVALSAEGTVTATLNTPVVTQLTTYTVTATFEARDGVERQAVVTVEASPAGALILNLDFDPDEVRSDAPQFRDTSLNVTFTREDAVVPGGIVTLTIGSGDAARANFASGNPNDSPTRVTLTSSDFASGPAEVPVVALPNVAPGIIRVTAVATAPVPGEPDETISKEIALEVKREPILQSIRSVTVPAQISVRGSGSSVPSSAVVTFELRDDSNRVMAGVPVTFSTNATADRGVQVTPSDISDQAGIVETVLSAGTIAGPVSVIVTARPVSADPSVVLPPLTVQSPTVAIVGGLPNFLSSFMACADAVPRLEGSQFDCSVTLVDRFSNLVDGQTVQFRSEGSGTNATASTAAGVASAALILDDGDTASLASVPGWSYGFLPTPADVPGFEGCFDDTITTPCNLLELCSLDANFCPLPLSCLGAAEAAAALLPSLSATDAAIDDYVRDHRACGFPVSCLLGDVTLADGVPGFPGDECAVGVPCMDYSFGTECPADGLMTVIASTRGEESFSDGNGNGVLDFSDLNANGRMDENEPLIDRAERCFGGRCEVSGQPCVVDAACTGRVTLDQFIDLPEPFLDKNDSCSRDDLTNVARLRFVPAEKVRHTDLFNDVDGNGLFGFTQGDALVEKNGFYDADTETFLTAHVLTFGRARFIAGVDCSDSLGDPDCVEVTSSDGLIGINETALPTELDDKQKLTILYRWADGFGNCPSEGFAESSTATADAAVEITGDTNLNLNKVNCGFATGSNAMAPYCEELPFLGAPVGKLKVTAVCEGLTGDQQAKIEWTMGEETKSISFTVHCPADTTTAP